MDSVDNSLEECCFRFPPRVYWSHERTNTLEGSCQYVAMQRMASAAGLAYLDVDSHLSLHPKFGPWFSLRCALVFDHYPWDGHQPPPLSNPMCATTQHYVKLAIETAIHCAERRLHRASSDIESAGSTKAASASCSLSVSCAPVQLVDKCETLKCTASKLSSCTTIPRTSCCSGAIPEHTCTGDNSSLTKGRYDFAAHDSQNPVESSKPSMDAVKSTWKRWLAVRDAPCPGHPWRYCEDQLQYHYTADKEVLLQALSRLCNASTASAVAGKGLKSSTRDCSPAKLVTAT